MASGFDAHEPVLTIGLAAERAGTSVPTLRMYEMEGLVIPFRTESGRRLYSYEDIRRFHCIRQLLHEEGLNLAGIRRLASLIPCWKLPGKPGGTHCQQENCPSQLEHREPCWVVMRRQGLRKDHQCRNCLVYRRALVCTREMKQLYREVLAEVQESKLLQVLERHLTLPEEDRS
ncbi:MAG: MerR family transcriptional regulator [candidate division KSB1 bacterium]|nr:MerR family transcriptional regulator [candidate division KSB1 bacterium]